MPLFLVALLPGLLVVVLLVFGLRQAPATQPPQERLRLTLQPFGRNFRLYLLALVKADAAELAGYVGPLWTVPAVHLVASEIEQTATGPSPRYTTLLEIGL